MGSNQTIRVHNWEKWQTYRRDRGQPPWIKVHRELMRHHGWVALSDAERGQLVSMWILAADQDGEIPADPKMIEKLCYMDATPDLQVFIDHGFLECDANVTPRRRHDDETEAETETETETEERLLSQPAKADVENALVDGLRWNARLAPHARAAGGERKVGDWLKRCRGDPDYYERVLVGLVSLRDRGALDFVAQPGDLVSPAILSIEMDGQPIEKRAIAEFWRLEQPSRNGPGGLERVNA